MQRWLGLLALLALARPGVAADVYLSPNGDDACSGKVAANAGRSDGPLRTLAAARDAVRKLRAAGRRGPLTVQLADGRYPLAEPLTFLPQDSGTPKAPVTYAAAPGAHPVVTGGRVITGWRVEGGRWVVTLPEARDGRWTFQSLFVDGRRAQRARIPNTGYLHVAGVADPKTDGVAPEVGFHYAGDDLQAWPDLDGAVVTVMHSWESSVLRVKQLDPQRHLVTFTGRSVWPFNRWGVKQRYYVENVRAGLDAPGEWYLDRRTGELTYLPRPGEDPARTEVVAPVTSQLMRFAGEPALGLPIGHLRFQGLAFEHCDWTLEPEGHSDAQAVSRAGDAIALTGARDVRFEGCRFAHLGPNAIGLRTGSRDCAVSHSEFTDLGVGAVRIGETAMPADDSQAVLGSRVENCDIHDYGTVFSGGVGVYVAQASDTVIAHNDISDGNYTGISVGWNWGSGPTAAHRNRVEANHIHHVLRGVMSDGGGIYLLGTSDGTLVAGNVVHDVWPFDNPQIGWGIYLDAETNGVTVEDNLAYQTYSGGLMMHNGAHNNTVRNNVFARCARQLIWRSPNSITVPNTFERNLCEVTGGELFYKDGTPDTKSTWDHNLYWRTDGKDLLFMEDSFEEWQARGLDRHSLLADPQFVDPAHDDFAVKPTSPAVTRLGFRPFDPAEAGLTGDAAWTSRPKQRVHPPTVMPAVSIDDALPVDDDYETTAAGEPPSRAVVSVGQVPGGHIEVSAERALSGKHSVKLTDAPGLQYAWDPHFFYQPNLRKGRLRLHFALNAPANELPWVEARDEASPYHAGPSFKLQAGRLLANGKDLMAVPYDQWLVFDATLLLGKEATGTYDLTVTVAGQPPKTFTGLSCDPKFRRLSWFGFVSLADTAATWYVDDVRATVE